MYPGGGMNMGGMGGMMNPCAAQGCVMCPPGTHDAGTCQPTIQNCGYNGVIGEMLEHVDHCGGNAMGNPALGGGNGMGVGYPGGGMYPGGMNMGGMGGMYPGGGMNMGGMGGMMNPCAAQGCVLCPPGTHDAGACQPTPQNCGYNGMLGEMLEHVDRCGGNAMGNPGLGGGNGMPMGMGMGMGYGGGGWR